MPVNSLYSYYSAVVAFAALLAALFFNRKNNVVFLSFGMAGIFSLFWASYVSVILQQQNRFVFDTFGAETLRNGAWYFFLSVLISRQQFNDNYTLIRRYWQPKAMLLLVLAVAVSEFHSPLRYFLQQHVFNGHDFRLYVHIGFALVGLMLVEQLYRNALMEQRWHIKFVCIATAGMFLFDFFTYSKSLLFSSLDEELWYARGLINALLAPLLILSINRLNEQPAQLAFSRKLIFHTTVLLGAGLYLLLMSLMGFYIRDYGGNWGGIAQIGFMFLAVILMLIFFVSGKVRAQAKVFLGKHLLQHRYDYREEWVKLSKSLAQMQSMGEICGCIIKTLADLVDSSGGGLWVMNQQGDFYLTEAQCVDYELLQLVEKNNSVIQFIAQSEWIVDFVEYENDPDIYGHVDLESWRSKDKDIWLIVPLCLKNTLEAFVVLSKPRMPRQIDWQDRDLLKTVGMQLANALALNQASDDLSRTRQFEAYNRMSAFLVHDLKNLVAQISMIVKNAERHKHNPEFIDDSIATLENVVHKTERILTQLRKGDSSEAETGRAVDLRQLALDIKQQQKQQQPGLQLKLPEQAVLILGDKQKLGSILTHLIQNAQDATANDGYVRLILSAHDANAIVKIVDNGCGMDRKFIQQRLFRPFDTTKGNAGMGIGVYEAREFVLQHSGHIFVESEVGKGTTFTLQFPLLSDFNEVNGKQ